MKTTKILLLVFLLALTLRVFRLGDFPVGFHSDEARVAWNSYSIFKTGKDDRGNILSLYYDTFGDYRPTGIFYFTIPSLLIFGRNEFAVRFPSALFGALAVFPLYYFVLEILKKNDHEPDDIKKKIALFSCLLLAISTWHIEVSRATSEVVISAFFALFAMYFLIKLIEFGRKKYAALTCIFITISFLLYHAIRILAPLFFITIILFYLKKLRRSSYKILVSGAVIFVCLLSIFFSITPEARKRLNQVAIPTDKNTQYEIGRLKSENIHSGLINDKFITDFVDSKYAVYAKRFLAEYSSYFNSNFLIGNLAKPYRYITPGTGLLTITELVLLAVGLIEIFKGKRNFLPLLLLLLAPLPAAVTTEDAPNLHRAFLMVPSLMIIEAYGLSFFFGLKNRYKIIIQIIVTFGLSLGSIYFLHMYFSHSALHRPFIKELDFDGSSFRNVGTKELALRLDEIKGQYDKIVVTNSTDDPYPWYAFFTRKDPKEFNQYAIKRKDGPWQYQNIIFSQMSCPTDSAFKTEKEKNLLVIESADCPYQARINDGLQAKVVSKILRPDASEVYVLLERK